MSSTTFRQKVFLILVGIITTIILLEIGLRLGGRIFTFIQESRNTTTFDPNEIRILCIGESTTALGGIDSYPSQLEEILNRYKTKWHFKVINKGLVGKTSTDILAQLDDNLRKYKPHIVVAMIGINDYIEAHEHKDRFVRLNAFLEQFRVYKLIKLLSSHIKHKIGEITGNTVKAQTIDNSQQNNQEDDLKTAQDALIETRLAISQLQQYQSQSLNQPSKQEVSVRLKQLNTKEAELLLFIGEIYRRRGEYNEAKKFLSEMILKNIPIPDGYVELGRVYKKQKQYGKAIAMFMKSLEIEPTVTALMELARCYNDMGMDEGVMKIYKMVLKADKVKKNGRVYLEIGEYFRQHNMLKMAEEAYKKGIKNDRFDYYLYAALSDIYRAEGKLKEAERYKHKAKEVLDQIRRDVPLTAKNYNEIADIVISRGIKFIAMQYPLRHIDHLKQILNNRTDVIYVENKKNFEQALKHSDYAEYFSDKFAFDFGHCTRKGNRLIAENLSSVIIKLMDTISKQIK